MPYPVRQQNPNGFQIAGQALMQGSGQLQDAMDRQAKMRADLEAMILRRQQAAIEQRRMEQEAEIQRQENERKAKEAETKQKEADRMTKAVKDFQDYSLGERKLAQEAQQKPYFAPGMGPNGEAAQEIPAQYQTVKPTREQMQQKALETGAYADPGVKAYFDDTNPTKTIEGQKEIFGVKSAAQEKMAEARMRYQSALEEYRQGRIDARTVMTLKAAMERAEMSDKSKPKTDSGMPLRSLDQSELQSLKNIQNTAYSISKIREMAQGISSLKKGPIVGRLIGKNPYDTELQALERLVNQTVPSLARGVFGEVGVLTDQDVERYRKMLAGIKDSPELANQIMDDLEAKIASAYNTTLDTYEQGGRDVSGFAKGLDFQSIVRGTRAPGRDSALSSAVDRSVDGIKPAGQEWIRDPQTGKLRPK